MTKKSLILATTCLGVLIAQIDTSVVNLALPRIREALGADTSTLQWVIDAYSLVYASLLLTGGTLGDLFGRRRIFAGGVALFVLGSLICGLAPGSATLVGGRAVAGLGAAFLQPCSLAILAAAYPDKRERAHALGIWAACNGLALAIGPTLGGLLLDFATWRSIFLLIVPIGALAFALAVTAVPETRAREGRRLDLGGQAFAIVALGGLTLAAIEAPRWGWTSALTLGALLASAVAAVGFLRVESRDDGGMVPLRLFRSAPFTASILVALEMTFGIYALLFLVPMQLQVARGNTAFVTGLLLLPQSLSFVAVSSLSGSLAQRLGSRTVMAGGMALIALGLWLLATVGPGSSLLPILGGLLATGAGMGLNTGPMYGLALESVDPGRTGSASGLVNTARIVGATLGVALLGAVYAVVAGPDPATPAMLAGMRAAFLGGGSVAALGAIAALVLVRIPRPRPRRVSLDPVPIRVNRS